MKIYIGILITAIVCKEITSSFKYNLKIAGDIDLEKDKDPITFNDLEVKSTKYYAPKVFVVGVLMMDNDPTTNFSPSDTLLLLLNQNIDLSVDPDVLKTGKGLDNMDDVLMPFFEVEYGKEPLQFLLDSMKRKYGLNCWANNSVGYPNQYGASYSENAQNRHLMTSLDLENYDPFNTRKQKGPLIGVVQGSAYSTPQVETFSSQASSKITSFWNGKGTAKDNKIMPAIFIGYTIGTNFNEMKKDYGFETPETQFKTSGYQTFRSYANLGKLEDSAVQSSNSYSAFVKMAVNLDNISHKKYSEYVGKSEEELFQLLVSGKRRILL